MIAVTIAGIDAHNPLGCLRVGEHPEPHADPIMKEICAATISAKNPAPGLRTIIGARMAGTNHMPVG